MAETDILNPSVRWRGDINDSIGPDFGFETLRRSQLATAKAAGGAPIYRTVGNAGHSGQFSWLNRSQKCVQLLKQWAERFEDGYFTLIDHDWGGRQYVGTFVGDMPVTQAGNDRYNIQGWQFVETPATPMLQYPSDWDDWAVQLNPYFDNGALRCAAVGNWTRPATITAEDGTILVPNALQNMAPANGDSITFEYRGYGFRLWGVHSGGAQVAIDGGAATALTVTADPDVLFENAEISLDIHRVVISMTSGANAGLNLNSFEVMR